MKTPGQRQLISLQERVKVGEITVDEAVQEFKAWQFDHERRSNSIRYQQVDQLNKSYGLVGVDSWSRNWSNMLCEFYQENLKKLRDSITRRHKEREKTGKELGKKKLPFIIWICILFIWDTYISMISNYEHVTVKIVIFRMEMFNVVSPLLDYEISAPLQRNFFWGSTVTLECSVYESTPRVAAAPPPVSQVIQRGSWKTGSTSSTSSESKGFFLQNKFFYNIVAQYLQM